MPTRVQVPPETFAGKSKRATTAAAKAALLAAVAHWHRTYLPGHFELTANRKYDYQPRRGDGEPPVLAKAAPTKNGAVIKQVRNWKYSWFKRRRVGHNRPLVFSGDSERAAKAGIRLSTRRVAAEDLIRGQGVMDLPKYFYQYRKDLNQPNKVEELLRTTAMEVDDLHRVFDATFKTAIASGRAGRQAAGSKS